MNRKGLIVLLVLLVSFTVQAMLSGCAPQRGGEKTLLGTAMGAGGGAATGAIIGNQVGNLGHGAAIGGAVGLLAGASSGIAHDLADEELLEQKKALKMLSASNKMNSIALGRLQDRLDHSLATHPFGGVYRVFFDVDATSLKPGAVATLQKIADHIKRSPYAYSITVIGHTDDSGSPEYNNRLAEARAREVASVLMSAGVNREQISIKSEGARLPIASNNTEAGRQLNRRVEVFVAN